MSKHSPVKSLTQDDAIIDGQRNPTLFYLKSPHPILDGVTEDGQNAKSRGVGDGTGTACNFATSIDLPSTRSYYPTYSEFVNAKRDRDADIANECAVEDSADVKVKNKESGDESGRPYLGRRMEMKRTMIHQAQQNDDGNLSEDGGWKNESDEIIVPTLETYVPREPCYEKANAIPFVQVRPLLSFLQVANKPIEAIVALKK
jgi:hypothetical protein